MIDLIKEIKRVASSYSWSNKKMKRGLTLVELAIVMLVLGIIMALVYSNLDIRGASDKARCLQLEAAANNLQIQLELYEQENPGLEDQESLEKLTERTGTWRGLKKKALLDPWKSFYFACVNDDGEKGICSYGADKSNGGVGDNADFDLTVPGSIPYCLKGNDEDN